MHAYSTYLGMYMYTQKRILHVRMCDVDVKEREGRRGQVLSYWSCLMILHLWEGGFKKEEEKFID